MLIISKCILFKHATANNVEYGSDRKPFWSSKGRTLIDLIGLIISTDFNQLSVDLKFNCDNWFQNLSWFQFYSSKTYNFNEIYSSMPIAHDNIIIRVGLNVWFISISLWWNGKGIVVCIVALRGEARRSEHIYICSCKTSKVARLYVLFCYICMHVDYSYMLAHVKPLNL